MGVFCVCAFYDDYGCFLTFHRGLLVQVALCFQWPLPDLMCVGNYCGVFCRELAFLYACADSLAFSMVN